MSAPRRVRLKPSVVRDVLDHALEAAPDECCGILVGPDADHVVRSIRSDNVHAEPRTRYEIDPAAIARAMDEADQGSQDVVGFYHSHPRGWPRFSKEDEARATWEGAVYLLVCLQPVTLVAAHWTGDRFEPCDPVVVSD